jgi:hypothetical protein
VEHEVYLTIMQNYKTKLNLAGQIDHLEVSDIPLATDIIAEVPK